MGDDDKINIDQGFSEEPEDDGREIQSQSLDGYGCSCGFKTLSQNEFKGHLMHKTRKEGKGTHRSIGRINIATGDVVMPPALERTSEQQKSVQFAARLKHKAERTTTTQLTNYSGHAMQIKFVPRIFTCTYTPIMRMAQECASREWKWRGDMPLENFIDTIMYHFFKDRGITLAGYIVEKAGEAVRAQFQEEQAKKKVEETSDAS